MAINRTSIASLMFLALSACGAPTAPAPGEPTAGSAENAQAAPTAAAAKPEDKPGDGGVQASNGAPAPAALVGRWGDNGDCTKDIVFNADGTFASYTGGAGRWALNGDRMTMSGAGGTFEVRVQVIDANRLMIFNPDGSVGTSQRC